MISEDIQFFLESLFDSKRTNVTYDATKGSKLILPLERNAAEQIKYANWLYGTGLNRALNLIKELQITGSEKDCFVFNYSNNSFHFSKPLGLGSDEFYFLFDYLKETFLEHDYQMIEAVKEGCSRQESYIEVERYSLVNSITKHSIKLEVINDRINRPYFLGTGYPIDMDSSSINNPAFFRIIKSMIQ
ncbi:MAG: hypothetical protein ACPGVC_04175 [Salibacteraceae bacterium]